MDILRSPLYTSPQQSIKKINEIIDRLNTAMNRLDTHIDVTKNRLDALEEVVSGLIVKG